MLRRYILLLLIIAMSLTASWWFYLGWEAGEGAPLNTLVRKVIILAAVGGLIAVGVVSIIHADDSSTK